VWKIRMGTTLRSHKTAKLSQERSYRALCSTKNYAILPVQLFSKQFRKVNSGTFAPSFRVIGSSEVEVSVAIGR